MKIPKQKALRKVIEFYSVEHKNAYEKFCQYIGGRSEQGMFRALMVYGVSRPQVMREVLMEYDKNSSESNIAKIHAS